MKTSKNNILITGGSAGIGFEIAKKFIRLGNNVLIVGRNKERLDRAKKEHPRLQVFQADVSTSEGQLEIVNHIKNSFQNLNILINNAGYSEAYDIGESTNEFNFAKQEIETNYLASISLINHLLQLLKKNNDAAIVNVTSIVAFQPQIATKLPTYAASKAAMHIYTEALRNSLLGKVNVFELAPPLVNTSFSKDVGGENGIPPEEVAHELIKGMETDQWLIGAGISKSILNL